MLSVHQALRASAARQFGNRPHDAGWAQGALMHAFSSDFYVHRWTFCVDDDGNLRGQKNSDDKKRSICSKSRKHV
jgi:hypothetical protein